MCDNWFVIWDYILHSPAMDCSWIQLWAIGRLFAMNRNLIRIADHWLYGWVIARRSNNLRFLDRRSFHCLHQISNQSLHDRNFQLNSKPQLSLCHLGTFCSLNMSFSSKSLALVIIFPPFPTPRMALPFRIIKRTSELCVRTETTETLIIAQPENRPQPSLLWSAV